MQIEQEPRIPEIKDCVREVRARDSWEIQEGNCNPIYLSLVDRVGSRSGTVRNSLTPKSVPSMQGAPHGLGGRNNPATAPVISTSDGSVARESPSIIRVMIVSEVRLYREGLAHVLALQPGLEVVDNTADDILARFGVCRPHIVLVDSTILGTTELVAKGVEFGAQVVAFAVAEENEKEVLACAEAGVAGFVAREATMDELVAVVRTASKGGLRCSPRVASILARRVATVAASRSNLHNHQRLTQRELEIGTLIDQGLSNKEIASHLHIETTTVKNHVHNLLEKLRIHRRGDAAAAIRGILPNQVQGFQLSK